jgi:hypothetical protein
MRTWWRDTTTHRSPSGAPLAPSPRGNGALRFTHHGPGRMTGTVAGRGQEGTVGPVSLPGAGWMPTLAVSRARNPATIAIRAWATSTARPGGASAQSARSQPHPGLHIHRAGAEPGYDGQHRAGQPGGSRNPNDE